MERLVIQGGVPLRVTTEACLAGSDNLGYPAVEGGRRVNYFKEVAAHEHAAGTKRHPCGRLVDQIIGGFF